MIAIDGQSPLRQLILMAIIISISESHKSGMFGQYFESVSVRLQLALLTFPVFSDLIE